MTPREPDSEWCARTVDDYYRVAKGGPPFLAYHVEALWAKPVQIASCVTLDLAQQACEFHAAREPAPV